MKIKTKDLVGTALDWAVAKCEGVHELNSSFTSGRGFCIQGGDRYSPSTDWAHGGPIIEREGIAIWPDEEGGYFASSDKGAGEDHHGPTYLIAAMRCYVASQLGNEVDVIEELVNT